MVDKGRQYRSPLASTARTPKGADMNVMIENGNIAGYKVNMAITFVLEEGEQPG